MSYKAGQDITFSIEILEIANCRLSAPTKKVSEDACLLNMYMQLVWSRGLKWHLYVSHLSLNLPSPGSDASCQYRSSKPSSTIILPDIWQNPMRQASFDNYQRARNSWGKAISCLERLLRGTLVKETSGKLWTCIRDIWLRDRQRVIKLEVTGSNLKSNQTGLIDIVKSSFFNNISVSVDKSSIKPRPINQTSLDSIFDPESSSYNTRRLC